MNKCFINGLGCISAQDTELGDLGETAKDYSQEHLISVIKPDYKSYISSAAIRRMGPSVKNGTVAATRAMEMAGSKEPDSIIVGTGMGCINDSEKFLKRMLNYKEEYLSPTPFIQSTHNTVAGQIALNLKSKAYNLTYVHSGSSFQAALLDGLMQIQQDNKDNVLVGAVDELEVHSLKMFRLIEIYKKEGETTYDILKSKTPGGVAGEGAAFFVLSREKQKQTLAEVADIGIRTILEAANLRAFLEGFLVKQNLAVGDVDVFISGRNGDKNFDHFNQSMESCFPGADVLFYKHLFGEFPTAPGMAAQIGADILKKQTIPAVLYLKNHRQKRQNLRNVLIYNQFRGENHSLILLKNV